VVLHTVYAVTRHVPASSGALWAILSRAAPGSSVRRAQEAHGDGEETHPENDGIHPVLRPETEEPVFERGLEAGEKNTGEWICHGRSQHWSGAAAALRSAR
jgi:hypothetical protein